MEIKFILSGSMVKLVLMIQKDHTSMGKMCHGMIGLREGKTFLVLFHYFSVIQNTIKMIIVKATRANQIRSSVGDLCPKEFRPFHSKTQT